MFIYMTENQSTQFTVNAMFVCTTSDINIIVRHYIESHCVTYPSVTSTLKEEGSERTLRQK